MTRFVALTVAAFALIAPAAHGAGLPLVGTDAGPAGVTAPGVPTRYVATRVRGHTLIQGIERRGGRINVTRITRRLLVVPAVAYDFSATGLSADGRTLVLARPRTRFPQRRSTFTVLDTKRLRPRATITLRGDFTLDAIAPDGERLYLIQSSQRFARYQVRAYDLRRDRLRRDPIVDPAEADEPMTGIPLSRAMSRDGRWAYTLYDGDEHPFIHALDTERGEAKCIDLEGPALGDARLRVGDDGTILVRNYDGDQLATVDSRTFAVNEPKPRAPVRRTVADDGRGWVWPVVGVAVLLLAAAIVRRNRVRDNVQPYAAEGLERDVVRTDVGAAGGNGTGGPRPAAAERERARP